MKIDIAGKSIPSGTIAHGFLEVTKAPDNAPIGLPWIVVNGKNDGPVLEIDGAVRGDEDSGTDAILRLSKHVKPEQLHGARALRHLNKLSKGLKNLRGCVGYPEPILPLVEASVDSAINSATGEPRFPPVSLRELDEIVVEVSVFAPMQLIKVKNPREYPANVKVGVDGLVVERGWNKGLLLP